MLATIGDLEFSDELVNAETEELRRAVYGIDELAGVLLIVYKLNMISVACVHRLSKRT